MSRVSRSPILTPTALAMTEARQPRRILHRISGRASRRARRRPPVTSCRSAGRAGRDKSTRRRDAVHALGSCRGAEARMRRRDDVGPWRFVQHGRIGIDADAGMQKQDRRPDRARRFDGRAVDDHRLIASGMREPFDHSTIVPRFPCTREGGVSRSCRNARSMERNIGMNTAKAWRIRNATGVTYATHDSVALAGTSICRRRRALSALVASRGGWVQGVRAVPALG